MSTKPKSWSQGQNITIDSFHVESAFKYLVDTIGQCGGCSDAVSTRIVSSCKRIRNCYLSSPTMQSEQNLEGMSSIRV